MWPCTSTAWKMFITKSKLTSAFVFAFRFVFKFHVPACTKPANDKGTRLDIKSHSGCKCGCAKRGAIKWEATMWIRKILEGKMWSQRLFRLYKTKRWLFQSVLMRIFTPNMSTASASFFQTSFTPFGFKRPVQRLIQFFLLCSQAFQISITHAPIKLSLWWKCVWKYM
jgi:hypothetical protein